MSKGVSILRDAGAAKDLRGALEQAADPQQWMHDNTQILKQDRHSLVGLLPGERSKRLFIKLYLAKGPLQRYAFSRGVGRACDAFDQARLLAIAGVPVPRPLACLQLPGAMMLATAVIDGAVDLKSAWQAQPGDPRVADLVATAGHQLGGMHRAGYAHGDCKWSNLLCSGERLFFADLEAVSSSLQGSAAQYRDVARFTVNAEDMAVPPDLYERFFRAYQGVIGKDREELLAKLRSPLRRLRRRHKSRYGERGHQLL